MEDTHKALGSSLAVITASLRLLQLQLEGKVPLSVRFPPIQKLATTLWNPPIPSHYYSTQLNGTYCLIFGRSQVQISAQRLTILTESICGFPPYLQLNAKTFTALK